MRWEELSGSYDQVAGRYQQEFQDENFVRMISNAVFWTAKRTPETR